MHDRHWVRKGLLAAMVFMASMAASGKENTSLCRQGWSSYSAGQYEEAIGLYSRCMKVGKLSPESLAKSHRNMGMAYNAKKDNVRAIDSYNKSLALKPDDFWFDYVNRGNAWSELKDYDKALADYEAALKAKPDLGSAFYNRGIVYERLGQVEMAKADIALAYAKGYRSPALTERMVHYQLPQGGTGAADRNKPD